MLKRPFAPACVNRGAGAREDSLTPDTLTKSLYEPLHDALLRVGVPPAYRAGTYCVGPGLSAAPGLWSFAPASGREDTIQLCGNSFSSKGWRSRELLSPTYKGARQDGMIKGALSLSSGGSSRVVCFFLGFPRVVCVTAVIAHQSINLSVCCSLQILLTPISMIRIYRV